MTLFLFSMIILAAEKDCNQTAAAQSGARIERVVAQAAETFETPDTRSYITKPELKHFVLSKEEAFRLSKTTGICACPGVKDSCGVGPDGEMILTNAHLFFDEKGQNRRPLTSCYFQNQAVPADAPIPFVFQGDSFRPGTLNPYKRNKDGQLLEAVNDHAVIKLARAVPGVKPFSFRPGGPQLRPGQWVLSVSGIMVNLPSRMTRDSKHYLSTPIVQESQVTSVDTSALHNGYFGTTARGMNGASGSLNFVRGQSGELEIVGIMQATCDDAMYDKVCAPDGTRTGNIMLGRYFQNDIMAVSRSSRIAQRPGSNNEM